ncbi:alkaline phosphatase [[Emmonsia] crescens]|uniref:NADH dehydrogenase [ubiquinone] 1 alpha subcomplex assembly factor 3 n=1 Tax=[Emmonsia] crescens TaxID=73230 RepID=A0A0G2HTJ1_9EURO|nr:alkaline phosphatase [Emmonsia crescens UAMH 3008]
MCPQTPTARLLRSLRSLTTLPHTRLLPTTITTSPAVYRHSLQRRTLPPSTQHIIAWNIPNQLCPPSLRPFSTTTSSNTKKTQPRQSQSQPHNVNNNSSRNFNRPRARDTDADEAAGLDGDIASESTLSALNVLADVAGPSTAIDACLPDGFQLDNGVKITDGDGCLLVDGEVFRWRPWEAGGGKGEMRAMINEKGQWEVSEDVWGLLKLVWPKPDLLILGLGASVYPISPETRRQINLLGIRIEVQDTRNAAAQFNLLATERGVQEVAAALIPLGWKGR